MKSLLQNFGQVIASTSYSVRVTIGIAILAIFSAAGYSAYRASNPHFEMLYGNLDSSTASQMGAALAEANVRFQLSQPPGPFAIYVESGSEYLAHNAIALSGATNTAPTGILTSNEGSSVFDGANERYQKSMKREWEEMENQLRLLTFVSSVRVTASIPDRSPFRRGKSQTVAVTLVLRGNSDLTKAQARTVAKLVRYRFDVPTENVIISDQFGNSIFDGDALTAGGGGDVQESRARYERELQNKANTVLDKVLGEGAAYVVVNSEWSYEQLETVRESFDPKGTDVSKSTEKTSTPVGSGVEAARPVGGDQVGGPVGSAGNLPGDTPPAAATPPPSKIAGEATTKSERTKTIVGKETEHRVSHMPILQRMSVSLFLDESLKSNETALMASVQAAVGFVADRDEFATLVMPFASLDRDEEGNIIRPEPASLPEEPSAMLGLVLKHGIEVIAALGFLFVLLKALKGGDAPKSPDGSSGGMTETAEDLNEIELERLAIAQVEELVRSEPERVAEILSAWALEDVEAEKVGS